MNVRTSQSFMKQINTKKTICKWKVDLYKLFPCAGSKKIIDILELFGNEGVLEMTREEIATRAGIKKPTVDRAMHAIKTAGIPIEFIRINNKESKYVLRRDLI